MLDRILEFGRLDDMTSMPFNGMSVGERRWQSGAIKVLSYNIPFIYCKLTVLEHKYMEHGTKIQEKEIDDGCHAYTEAEKAWSKRVPAMIGNVI